jgi:hypothetical protein
MNQKYLTKEKYTYYPQHLVLKEFTTFPEIKERNQTTGKITVLERK